MKKIQLAVVMCLWAAFGFADERIWVDAMINGKRAQFIFDTGADQLILFRNGADRLGLHTTDAPANFRPRPGMTAVGLSEPCQITLWQSSYWASLTTVAMPAYLNTHSDGVVGWRPVSHNIILIDAAALKINFLEDVPKPAADWTRLGVRTNLAQLFLEIPENGRTAIAQIDTGSSDGVSLSARKWREWKASHPKQPITLDSYFMPGAGVVVKEQMWAKELTLGPLRLTDVLVVEANSAQSVEDPLEFDASLGLAALKRMQIIVDGKDAVAYVLPRTNPASPSDHNRLGAVFVPANAQSNDLLARVVPRSPADEAGIRGGDQLLKVGDLDVTRWRTDPGVLPLSRFWDRPAGTKLNLLLRREGKDLKITVKLRHIFK